MATNVTYKGSTLVEFESTTKVLKTSGKYMEDDVTILDDTVDGDPLGYGNNTTSMVGAGQVGYMIVGEDTTLGMARIGDRLA